MSGKIAHEEAVKPMKAALENCANFWNAVSTSHTEHTCWGLFRIRFRDKH